MAAEEKKEPASIARILTMSRNRAKDVGAYSVERLTPGGFVLCIRKEKRVIAVAGADATQEEILGMAATPAIARALVGLIKATPEERAAAETRAKAALFAAGVSIP